MNRRDYAAHVALVETSRINPARARNERIRKARKAKRIARRLSPNLSVVFTVLSIFAMTTLTACVATL